MTEKGKATKPLTEREDVFAAAKVVAERLKCDIVLLNSTIERGVDNDFILSVRKHKRAKTLLMLLVTPGGDADAAYRIARCAQDCYERFIVFVSGYCKSAGTLCVLGANEVVMSDQGELGPLDVQLYKRDELGEMHSGLVIGEALQHLQEQAFSMFETYFLEIKRRSANNVTFKTATETAAKMVTGLFQPIYSQIDPSQIGDIGRSMTIAKDYGKRLLVKSQNFTVDTLDMLVESYPAHGFVIDRREAEQLFSEVRAPEADEERLARRIAPFSRFPNGDTTVEFLYPNVVLEAALKEKSDANESKADVSEGDPAIAPPNAGTGSDDSDPGRTGSDDSDPGSPEGATQPDTQANAPQLPTGTNG
jgi:hypothetical protein